MVFGGGGGGGGGGREERATLGGREEEGRVLLPQAQLMPLVLCHPIVWGREGEGGK